ncbi:unnamed protein product [Vicia faba]|uniref:Uncharacterized protein n=1 Tax=Vicia faba TaxID=3906 RepID=A0AAV0Z121_VICFA|nr:unnamed protein product [Vicia faba]
MNFIFIPCSKTCPHNYHSSYNHHAPRTGQNKHHDPSSFMIHLHDTSTLKTCMKYKRKTSCSSIRRFKYISKGHHIYFAIQVMFSMIKCSPKGNSKRFIYIHTKPKILKPTHSFKFITFSLQLLLIDKIQNQS